MKHVFDGSNRYFGLVPDAAAFLDPDPTLPPVKTVADVRSWYRTQHRFIRDWARVTRMGNRVLAKKLGV